MKRSLCALGVLIEEEWDTSIPGCPIVPVTFAPEFKTDRDDGVVVRRSFIIPYDRP